MAGLSDSDPINVLPSASMTNSPRLSTFSESSKSIGNS
eukprot:12579.XXX_452142_452255_1 [CDS] Oithona nana genome sequencing.